MTDELIAAAEASALNLDQDRLVRAYMSWQEVHGEYRPNPFELVLKFLKHGGTWRFDHDGTVEIYDAFGNRGIANGTRDPKLRDV